DQLNGKPWPYMKRYTWFSCILPYIEESNVRPPIEAVSCPISASFVQDQSNWNNLYDAAKGAIIKSFVCPADFLPDPPVRGGEALTSYKGNAGTRSLPQGDDTFDGVLITRERSYFTGYVSNDLYVPVAGNALPSGAVIALSKPPVLMRD